MSDETSQDTLSSGNTGVDLFLFWSTPPFRVEFTLVLLHINKLNPKRGCAQKKEEKGHHLPCCLFFVSSGPNCHRARVRCHIAFAYRVKRLNTAVLVMLAD